MKIRIPALKFNPLFVVCVVIVIVTLIGALVLSTGNSEPNISPTPIPTDDLIGPLGNLTTLMVLILPLVSIAFLLAGMLNRGRD